MPQTLPSCSAESAIHPQCPAWARGKNSQKLWQQEPVLRVWSAQKSAEKGAELSVVMMLRSLPSQADSRWCPAWFWKCWCNGCSGNPPSASGWPSCRPQKYPGTGKKHKILGCFPGLGTVAHQHHLIKYHWAESSSSLPCHQPDTVCSSKPNS